jgi:hypothetical protein
VSREAISKWQPQANALSVVRTNFDVPMRVFLGEAVDAARFVQAYWEPVKDQTGKVLRPGLSLAGAKLSPQIGAEILELEEGLQTAQTDYLLTVAPAQPDVRARAEYILGELTAALEWLLDDGVEDDRDKQLAALKAEYADHSTSTDSLAAELSDYAALARQESKGLEGLGGIELSLIDEAEQLAKQLRSRPSTPAPAENTRRALDLRNRLATLLYERIATVRAAARFVFRNHPEIAREVGSAYVRRKRAAARRAAAKAGNGVKAKVNEGATVS